MDFVALFAGVVADLERGFSTRSGLITSGASVGVVAIPAHGTTVDELLANADLALSTAKAAINNFSKGLAQQLAPKGIRVNVVAPGPIWTPLQTAGGQPTEDLPEFGQSTPLGRPGQPAELAPAYVFLASSESSYVSGSTLHVNGGMPTP